MRVNALVNFTVEWLVPNPNSSVKGIVRILEVSIKVLKSIVQGP